MRLVSWNCCQKFAANYVHLRDLDFDVAVVAECRPDGIPDDDDRALTTGFVQPVRGGSKHLGVLARAPWQATRMTGVEPRAEVVPLVEGPIVLAGDFDAPISSTTRAHAANVEVLAHQGLVSAYTSTRGTGRDHEEPTFYRWMRHEHPFHIDHVFVPQAWVPSTSLAVGRFDEWVASGRSDHVPLVVDVATDATRTTVWSGSPRP